MRVYFSKSLMPVLEGFQDWMTVAAVVDREVDAESEKDLRGFIDALVIDFNERFSTRNEPVKLGPEPIVEMPDEFVFHVDLERMGSLAREALIFLLPDEFAMPGNSGVRVLELWVGGKGELLDSAGKGMLRKHVRQIWDLPVRGKHFALGADIEGIMRQALSAAITERGGFVEKDGDGLDYFVTDDLKYFSHPPSDEKPLFINTLMLRLMTGPR